MLHVQASGAETVGGFNTGFDTINLNRPTLCWLLATNWLQIGAISWHVPHLQRFAFRLSANSQRGECGECV